MGLLVDRHQFGDDDQSQNDENDYTHHSERSHRVVPDQVARRNLAIHAPWFDGETVKATVSGHHTVSDVHQVGIHPSRGNQLIHNGHCVTPCAERLQVDIGRRLS